MKIFLTLKYVLNDLCLDAVHCDGDTFRACVVPTVRLPQVGPDPPHRLHGRPVRSLHELLHQILSHQETKSSRGRRQTLWDRVSQKW